MRSFKLALAGVCALGLFGFGAAKAEPVKIRMSWVAPVANWASIILEKKDLAKHILRNPIAILIIGGVALWFAFKTGGKAK